jgi:RHS repeat-associated protein
VRQERAAEGALTETQGQAYGYVGNELDAGTGLGHFDARPYDYQSARFLGPDPMRLFPAWDDKGTGRRQALLTGYAYTAGNPIGLSDTDGRDPGGIIRGWNIIAGVDTKTRLAAGQKFLDVNERIEAITQYATAEFHAENAVNSGIKALRAYKSGDKAGYLKHSQDFQKSTQASLLLLHSGPEIPQLGKATRDTIRSKLSKAQSALTRRTELAREGGDGIQYVRYSAKRPGERSPTQTPKLRVTKEVPVVGGKK